MPPLFKALCCSAWELKGIECSSSVPLLHDPCLTIYAAILKPALAPQETNTEVLLDLSAWGGALSIILMYKYCMLCAC